MRLHLRSRVFLALIALGASRLLAAGETAPATPWAVPTASGFTVPGLPAVTGRIHVDQFGYLPDERKVAILSDPQAGYNAAESYKPGKKLEVRRVGDDAVVFKDEPELYNAGKTDAASGDRGWWFDFTKVDAVGDYYVFDPEKKLRSHVFRIAPDVYHGVLRAAVRALYYQREDIAHRPPFAEEPWTDAATYTQDRRARSLAARDDASTERDLSGGWMDAGDTNKYPTFLPEVIHPLLYAWRENRAAFTDDFAIPESGNGLPDLLDEVKYELDWLVKMQDTDGGVFIKMGVIDYAGGAWPLSQDKRPRYYGPKASASTLASAGIFAHAARVYREFPEWKSFAADLEKRAIRAWKWCQTNPRSYEVDDGTIKSGDADKNAVEQDRWQALAAMHLWVLTGHASYHDAFRKGFVKFRQIAEPFWSPYESGQAEALLDYTRQKGADKHVEKRILEQLRNSTKSPKFMPQDEKSDLYRAWVAPESFHWGSVLARTGYGKIAQDAVIHGSGVPKKQLRQRALDMLHSMHGVNPVGIVYLTTMGGYGAEVSATRIWHDWFMPGTPLAANPVPGLVVGGPNHSYTGDIEWLKKQPDAKCYADFNEPWPSNSWELTEPAIYYQAMYVRLLANFARPYGVE